MIYAPHTHLTDDSRHVEKGSVFVLDIYNHPQGKTLAPQFIKQAQENGAAEIITNIEIDGTTFHPQPGDVLSQWAVQKWPNAPETCVGVTGTNGKTSVAWFYRQLALACKNSCASIGTLGVYSAKNKEPAYTGYTTPTAPILHEKLEKLAAQNISHCAIEVGSHALALHRADGVRFKAAALTNITQDHLDFHGSMEHYAAAKARLFTDLLEDGGIAVLPIQLPLAWPIAAMCKEAEINTLTTGTANAELTVNILKSHAQGLEILVKYQDIEHTTNVPLLGTFQAANLATTLGLGIASGLDFNTMLNALPHLTNVPGRMEIVPSQDHQPTVIVDFAHTADALNTACAALKPLVPAGGKLITVFGAGGDRDTTKRIPMGQAAAKHSDLVIITDDNPRTEDPAPIRAEVQKGAPDALNISPREDAIAAAINQATEKDIILLAGKGHESGQIIGKETFPFDDRLVAQSILEK